MSNQLQLYFKNNSKSINIFLLFSKILALSFILYSFIIIKLGTFDKIPSVEFNFYESYTESLIQDFDLNILNNIPKQYAWIVSPTFNYPEMHDHGGPVLWLPFIYLLSLFKIKTTFISTTMQYSQNTVLFFILNFILFSVALILTAKIYRHISKTSVNLFANIFVIFGTGLFYFSLVEYNGTENTLFFYTSLIFLQIIQIRPDDKPHNYLFFGILFAFGHIIKIHFLSYLLAFSVIYYLKNSKLQKKEHLLNFIYFNLGFFSLLALLEYNNYLKFGFFNIAQGYQNEFSIDSFVKLGANFITYFGPIGFFYVTPIFLFSFILFVRGAYRWVTKKNILFTEKLGILLYSSVIIKLIILEFLPTPGLCEFGGRNFIIDSAAHIILISNYLTEIKINRRKYYFILSLGFLACSWTLLHYFWQNQVAGWKPDQRMAHYIWDFDILLSDIKIHYGRLYNTLKYFRIYFLNNINLFYLCFILAFFVFKISYLTNFLNRKKNLSFIAIYLFCIYTLTTFINSYFNPINSLAMKQSHSYENIVVGNGSNVFTYDNMTIDLLLSLELDKYYGFKDDFEFKKKWYVNYLNHVKNEVIEDKINFLNTLNSGKLPKVGLLDLDDESIVLDYSKPHRFKNKSHLAPQF